MSDRDLALKSKMPWLVSSTWRVLHFVPTVTEWETWWDDVWPDTTVTAICGRTFKGDLPGLFSRMGAPRCKDCCRKLDIPQGDGCPVNELHRAAGGAS